MKKLLLPIVVLLCFFPVTALALQQISNVEIESGTTTAGIKYEAGASTYVIDLTQYRDYQGDVLLMLTGVTTDGTADPDAGVSIFYANGGQSTDSTHSSWKLADWTAITTANAGILFNSGLTEAAIDVPINPASPYLGLKFTSGHESDGAADTGTSPFWYSFRVGIH